MDYVHLTAPGSLPEFAASRPCKAILILDEAVPEKRRMEISAWLVDAGCRYVMVWGRGCDAWPAAIERANRAAFGDGAIPDDRVVIVTGHADQAMTDVFWFSKHSAMHPCHALDDVVLVHLAPTARGRELADQYRNA